MDPETRIGPLFRTTLRPARPASEAPPPLRRKRRRGRVRDLVRTGLAVALMASAPALLWAWQEGHVQEAGAWAGAHMIEGTAGAGFTLARIRASGHAKTPDSAIVEVLGLTAGAPLFGLEMQELRERVEALPWVRRAVVTRELPDTVRVYIEERVPVARWQLKGRLMLVDGEGAAIPARDLHQYAELPLLVGEGAPEAAPALFALLARQPALAERVAAAIRVGTRRWDIEFDTGLRLKLPEAGKDYGPAEAWAKFAELAEREGAFRLEVASFDLRLPGRVVMKLTEDGEKDFARRQSAT